MAESRSRRRLRTSCSAFVTLALAVCGLCAAQDALDTARDAVALSNQARSALEKLLSEGISSAMQQEAAAAHQADTERHLLLARDAFQAAGLPENETLSVLREYISVLRGLGDHDLIAEALEWAITLAPGDAFLRVELGESYAKIGAAKRREAFKTLRAALGFELTAVYQARTWFQLGRLYFDEGLYDFAREAFDKVIEAQPGAVRSKIALAALDVRDGHIARASNALDALGLEAQPFDIEIRALLRRALVDFDEARRHFPDTAENHFAYGKLLYRAARVQEAIGAVEHAARRDPNSTAILNFLATIHMQLGNGPAARSAYEKSLALDPIQPGVRKSLATIPPGAG